MAHDVSAGGAPVRKARAGGESVAQAPQFEWLARAGLVARGVVYAIVGVLAVKLALGDGGKATNQKGALETIARQPFGKVLLVLMVIGLAGYAIWRLTRAALGHGPEAGDDGKERAAGLASGIAYAVLCVTAITILIGTKKKFLEKSRTERWGRAWSSSSPPSGCSATSPAWSSSP